MTDIDDSSIAALFAGAPDFWALLAIGAAIFVCACAYFIAVARNAAEIPGDAPTATRRIYASAILFLAIITLAGVAALARLPEEMRAAHGVVILLVALAAAAAGAAALLVLAANAVRRLDLLRVRTDNPDAGDLFAPTPLVTAQDAGAGDTVDGGAMRDQPTSSAGMRERVESEAGPGDAVSDGAHDACEWLEDWIHIDIIKRDKKRKLIRLDATRRLRVANRLHDRDAAFSWSFDIVADAPAERPAMKVYAPRTRLLTAGAGGRLTPIGEAQLLGPARKLQMHETYALRADHLMIAPGELRQCRSRVRLWRRLDAAGDAENAFTIGVAARWRATRIVLSNSLAAPICARIVVDASPPRDVSLAPGVRKVDAFLASDAPMPFRVLIFFSR